MHKQTVELAYSINLKKKKEKKESALLLAFSGKVWEKNCMIPK